MKKNQINAILINQTKRRNTVFAFICSIVIIFLVTVSFFYLYKQGNKEYFITYDESSNINYDVYLKENEFFQNNYLKENKQYIANLIDYITAKFEYNISLDQNDIEYKYSYRIESTVDVVEKSTNYSLYNKTETLLVKDEIITDQKFLSIKEDVNIDYTYYNELISRFVEVYELDNTISTLNINMYINVIGACEEFGENKENESVISLSIPLTTNTVAIDLSDNLVNAENKLMQCKEVYENSFIFIIFGTLFSIIDIILIVATIRYEIKTRTAENIYEKELKKILNNYGSYIQTMSSDFDFKSYQMLKIENFNDMLEIRDTIRQPILMKENDNKTGAYFLIPSNTKILYVYRLKVSDIKKEMKKEM